MKFTKNDTLCAKGIAILLMFFHHDFLGKDRWLSSPVNFAPFSQEEVIYIAAFFKICVGMFVFLSGYGMMASARDRVDHPFEMRRYVVNRWVSMMLEYIPVFLLVQIASFPTHRYLKVYGSGESAFAYFIIDMFGLAHLFKTPTFCATWWYMSLAFLLIVIFPFTAKFLKKYQGLALLAAAVIPIAFQQHKVDLTRWLLCFCVGIYSADHNLLARARQKFEATARGKQWLIGITMLFGLWLIVKLRQHKSLGPKMLNIWEALAPAYVILFSYILLQRFDGLAQVLRFLGRHATNMFLTHTMFRAVYFHDFMYSFYYWWLDYIVLIIVSVASSAGVEWIKKILHYQSFSALVKNKLAKNFDLREKVT